MTPDELIAQQLSLHEEGQNLLDSIQIIPFMSKFGTPKIVGSFQLGLMVWPDIDIELEKEINESDYWETVHFIFQTQNLKNISIMDFRKSNNPITPKGLYINAEYYRKDNDPWNIDIWFIPPRNKIEDNFNEWMQKNLKEEHRVPILQIKQAVYTNPQYRKQIFSVDIYKAVIEKGVKNIEGFKQYLNETNRKID
jgi:hypothetical protein